MLTQIRNKILAIKKVAAVELTILSEDSFLINLIILEIKKGQVVIDKTCYNLKTFSAIKEEIKAGMAVSLIINGKGLLHKKTDFISDNLPQSIFPGINPADFLYQYFESQSGTEVAIIRKNTVDDILNQLEELLILPVSLSLAFYDIQFITEIINHTGKIVTSQYNLTLADKKIISYTLNSNEEKEILVKPEINIDSIYLKSNFLIPYASATKLLIQGFYNNTPIQHKNIITNQKKAAQTSLLKAYALGVLIFFLCLLLFNFFIYSHYFSKNNELVSKNQYALQQKKDFDSLSISMKNTREFLTSSGWIDDSRMISFYADRIALTVPEPVTLTSLNLYPAAPKLSFNSKQWIFRQDTILISGECSDPSLLDNWVKEIEKIKNVTRSKIISYLYKKQGETGFFNAEVIVK